jgi:hypothetical protein
MEPMARANTKTRLVNFGIQQLGQQKRCLSDLPMSPRFPTLWLPVYHASADKTGANAPILLRRVEL